MNIHDYLIKYTKNINENDICNYDMENFDKFKKFIDNHYTLNHLKNNNYIKYVKVIRQKIVLMGNNNYEMLINKINKSKYIISKSFWEIFCCYKIYYI